MGIWDQFYERAKSFFAEGEEGATEPKSRCYYDLLQVSRDATEDDIKRSFKRLALRWHPDKNPDRAEECTAYFVLIQQAYEVLLDPQERAFYDRHRENIIFQQQHKADGGVEERRDTGINLEPYMSASCFRTGGGSGGLVAGLLFSTISSAASSSTAAAPVLDEADQEQFFTVYRDLFHKLAAEEYAYIDDPEERNYPVFGKSTSDYDTVVAPFYAFWLDFSTQRSFAWLDKWDLRQAPDRPNARAMDKENKKMRELGRKQRSEQVRKVVEFVRRYDVRVHQAKERQRERNARIHEIVEEQRLQTLRRNLANMPAFEQDAEAHQQHLAHLDDIERALDAEFGTMGNNEEDEDGDHDETAGHSGGDQQQTESGGDSGGRRNAGTGKGAKFRCIVCEKNFNSKNVLISHERSKKHRQTVELLRVHMREEDRQLFGDDDAAAEATTDAGGDDAEGGGGRRRRKKKRGGNTAAAAATPE